MSLPSSASKSSLPSSSSGAETTCQEASNPVDGLQSQAQLKGLQHGAIATDQAICSDTGLSILQKGGNAVDAAVTTALCLGVVNPTSSGLGGGGFMLVHMNDPLPSSSAIMPSFTDSRNETWVREETRTGKVTEVIDCREEAPGGATSHMFVGEDDLRSRIGGLAIAVPGELRGLELAHARHGRLPWSDLIEPVVSLARKGLPVGAYMADKIREVMEHLENDDLPEYVLTSMEYLKPLVTRNNNWSTPLVEGDIFFNPKLADTLEEIRLGGADVIYKGARAAQLVEDIQRAGGIVTMDDLANYKAILRSPVVAHDVGGVSLVGVPPPSSGGATLIGALRMMLRFSRSQMARFGDTQVVHEQVEAAKHAFVIRMSLSDPLYNSETVEAAIQDLVYGSYIYKLAYKSNDTLPLSMYGGPKWAKLKDQDGQAKAKDAKEGDRLRKRQRRLKKRRRYFGYLNDYGTSHFTIVDGQGNAVSMTTSINAEFGSGVLSPQSGILLGNTMDDFATPGHPDYFGLTPSEANYIAPGKRPLSSMSPTMVFVTDLGLQLQLGSLLLAVGGSGGPKIISALLSVIVHHIFQGKTLWKSFVTPRVHDQVLYHGAAVTTVEESVLYDGTKISVSNRTRKALERRGHHLLAIDYEGTCQAISVDPETGEMTAVSDVRKGGSPAGY